jgi:hypothetical protein
MADYTNFSGNDYSGADAQPTTPSPDVPVAANPDPGPAPDLGAASPNSSWASILSGGQSQAPAPLQWQNAPTQQQQAPQATSWRSILQGALLGMAGGINADPRLGAAGGFANAAAGTVQATNNLAQQRLANQMAQQAQDASIKWQSVQAAHMAAETTMLAKQVATFDSDHQADVFSRNLQNAKTITEITGQQPNYVTTNDGASEQAALQDATSKNGNVAPYISIQVGPDKFLHFNAPQMVQSGGALDVVNDLQKRLGQPVFQTAPGKPGSQQEQQQIGQAAAAASRWNVTSDPQALQVMRNDLAQISNLPDSTYKKAESIATLNKSISTSEKLVQSAQDAANKKAFDAARSNAEATGTYQKNMAEAAKAQQDKSAGKPVYGVTPDGRTVMATAGEAQSQGLTAVRPVTAKNISDDQHSLKVLNDVQLKSDNVANAADAMNANSWAQTAGVAKYLADNPNTTADSLTRSAIFGRLSKPAQDYAISVLSLRESAMGMQKVLTGSARSNESQIKALQATLPGLEPNSGVVHQKLQNFNQNLGMLSEGLPEGTGVTNRVRASGPTQQTISVTAPDGGVHTFKDQASANKFKQLAGIK